MHMCTAHSYTCTFIRTGLRRHPLIPLHGLFQCLGWSFSVWPRVTTLALDVARRSTTSTSNDPCWNQRGWARVARRLRSKAREAHVEDVQREHHQLDLPCQKPCPLKLKPEAGALQGQSSRKEIIPVAQRTQKQKANPLGP